MLHVERRTEPAAEDGIFLFLLGHQATPQMPVSICWLVAWLPISVRVRGSFDNIGQLEAAAMPS